MRTIEEVVLEQINTMNAYTFGHEVDLQLMISQTTAEIITIHKEEQNRIDKIRAEIENINLNEVATKYEDRFYGFQQEVLQIIDKKLGINSEKGEENETSNN